MVRREIRWTLTAQKNKFDIFEYWNNRNKSNKYSQKLDEIFNKAIENLLFFPFSGSITNIKNVRILVVENYLIVYEIFENTILISRIWDGRRNPENLKI